MQEFDAKASIQAMVSLLLANLHSPELRPGVTLTDLRGSHCLFWLDGFTLYYYAAADAESAWTMTESFLRHPEDDASTARQLQMPALQQHILSRRPLQLGKAFAGTEAAQLSDLAGMLPEQDIRRSQAAGLLRELLTMSSYAQAMRSAPASMLPPPDHMYT